MINPAVFLQTVIDPSCAGLSGIMSRDMGGNQARVLLLAISIQESGLAHRIQVGTAGQHARGLWQFEKGGGVHGVCTHPASKDVAGIVCEKLIVPFAELDIHQVIAWNDFLAAGFARLLLYTDPAPLPQLGDVIGAMNCYLRTWRPKGWENPPPEITDRWVDSYMTALNTVMIPTGTGVGV